MRRIGALAAVIATAMLMSPVTSAAPGGGAVATSPTLALPDLGASGTIVFNVSRDNARTSVTFPVPTGLVPVALRAKLEFPVSLRFGYLAASQNGLSLSRMTLPAQDESQMVIPLTGVELSGDWVTIDFTLTAVPLEGYCWDDYAAVRLVNGEISFVGAEKPPTTVADFLPPVLRKVTIGMPARPSPAESSAAVQVATAVARRNGQSPEVDLVPLPEGATALGRPSAPLERQIIVKEGQAKGLSLKGAGVPALVISGRGEDLVEQARVLSDDSLRFAVSTTAVPGPVPEPELLADRVTVGEMRDSGLFSESMWPKVNIEIDQTRFGHPLAGIQVHLVGSYTPLPGNFGGDVTISLGGDVIERWAATPDGVIDRIVTIPDRLLKRFVNLEVAVRTDGNPGHCGDHFPMALKIEDNTEIRVGTAVPPVPEGFQSFPQALMPEVKFGIGSNAFADTVRAAKIAVGLQKVSGVPLTTEVTTLKEALGEGGSAVLISSDGWNPSAYQLPFSVDNGKITVQGTGPDGDPMTMKLEPEARFGSLQTIFDGPRALLIATSNNAPGQLDELLKWLDGSGRWAGLNGRAIISVPDSEPLIVASPPIAGATQAGSATAAGQQDWFWWVVGGVGGIAALGALLILLRARRHQG